MNLPSDLTEGVLIEHGLHIFATLSRICCCHWMSEHRVDQGLSITRPWTMTQNAYPQYPAPSVLGCSCAFGCRGLSACLWGNGLVQTSPRTHKAVSALRSPWLLIINTRPFGVEAPAELGTMFGIIRNCNSCLLSHLWKCQKVLKGEACCLHTCPLSEPRH